MPDRHPPLRERLATPSPVFAAEPRVPVLAGAAGPAVGVADGAGMAAPAHRAEASGGDTTSRRRWWRTALRVVRDVGIAFAVIVALPLVEIARMPDVMTRDWEDVRERLARIEPLRQLAVPVDPTVTPLDAGIALHELAPRGEAEGFTVRPVAATTADPWDAEPEGSTMFPTLARSTRFRGPDPSAIITAAFGGVTDAELAWLQRVAEAPVWTTMDRVARADRVDVLAGAFVLPFEPDASPVLMSIPGFARLKELAYANNARAAYHVARGETDRAEAALRATVSLGFALIDDSESAIGTLIGMVVAGIGRDGLHQLYTVTGDAAGIALTAAPTATPNRPAELSAREKRAERARIRASAGDPSLPRSLRLGQVFGESLATCTSVRGALFGPDEAAAVMHARARRELVRFPSERAYLALLERASAQPFASDEELWERLTPYERVVMGAATVAATVLQRPALPQCTRMALDMR